MFNVEENIERNVLILSIYKKAQDETLNDILIKLTDTNMCNLKEAKQLLKNLKKDKILINGALSTNGIELAKKIELAFKI